MSETELKHDVHGWNFEIMDDGRVFVCKGGHPKHHHCEEYHEEMTPDELVQLVNDMAAALGNQSRPADTDMEKLASWMCEHGYATGHGDTMDDLLAELSAQHPEGDDE